MDKKIDWSTIVQAARELGVLEYHDQDTGALMWCLPDKVPKGVPTRPVWDSYVASLDS